MYSNLRVTEEHGRTIYVPAGHGVFIFPLGVRPEDADKESDEDK